MRKNGFTLVETLVVMAVICTLMCLLLPALAGSRASARTCQCANNLKQLSLGWLCYVQAKNDTMMPWMTHDVALEPNYPRYWFGAVDKSKSPAEIVYKDGILAPYLETNKIVVWDPDFGPKNVSELRYRTFTTSYAYNRTLGPGTSYQYDNTWNVVGVLPPFYVTNGDPGYTDGTVVPPLGRDYESVRTKASTLVFADSALGLDASYMQPGLRENWSLDAPNPGAFYWVSPTLHYRHTGSFANVAFADGHIDQVGYAAPPASLWNSYTIGPGGTLVNWFSQQKLGFFGEDNSAYNPSGQATGDE